MFNLEVYVHRFGLFLLIQAPDGGNKGLVQIKTSLFEMSDAFACNSIILISAPR